MPGSISQRLFKAGELLSYAAGVCLTGFFLVQIAQGEVERRSGIEQFEQLASIDFSDPDAAADAPAFEDTTGEPDTTLVQPRCHSQVGL